nr:MAG TPA: zinc finger protein [Caudoviricetes sp.]
MIFHLAQRNIFSAFYCSICDKLLWLTHIYQMIVSLI